ncbi:hypothetical protein F4776DRAFT_315233 [Hypoxylon sp. NC0597]|nr:hypothetical protein F4776DRAFT_315233 [Hypoxylon sp. NC0597]
MSSPSKISSPGQVPHSDPILFSDDEIHPPNQMLTSAVEISGGNDGTSPDATQTGEPLIPKVVVLIGQTAEPFLIPVVSLTNLSQRFADHVLIRLPTKHYTGDVNDKELVKDEAVVWEQMDIPMFQLLGDFQLRRDYSVPILAKPLDQQTGDAEARSEFAQHAENVNTILLWSEWLNQLDLDIDRMVRPFYGDFLEEFGADIIANPNPPDTSFEDFLPHAKLYMLSVRFDIVGLGELALKKLTILVLRAHLTFDFAGAFAQLVRFVLLNTGKDDALRKRIYKIRTLVVNLFMKNPKFAAVFEEFREFSNEIMYMRVAQ